MGANNSTILVIEDEWTSRRFLTEALSDIAKVRCVASASEAYNALSETADDIVMVVTDIIMRGQSGLDLLSYLRNDLNRKDIPVLIYTAHGGTDMERLAFEAGATEFLPKPIPLPKLRLRVAAIFALTQAMAKSVSSPILARRVLDLDALTKVLRDEVERAIVGGYALLVCRAHVERFLTQGGVSPQPREAVLQAMADGHFEQFGQPYSWVWQDASLGFGVITMSDSVDSALRESRLYRAWLSERVLLEGAAEADNHVGLGMLVYDFAAVDSSERVGLDVNQMAAEIITRVDRASRTASESSSVMVTVVQDVVTV